MDFQPKLKFSLSHQLLTSNLPERCAMQYPWGTTQCSLQWELSLTWAELCFHLPSVSAIVRNMLSLQSAFLPVCWQFPSKFNFRTNIMACSMFTVCFIHLPSHGQLVICGEDVRLSFKQPRLNGTAGKYCGKREMWIIGCTCRKDWGTGMRPWNQC